MAWGRWEGGHAHGTHVLTSVACVHVVVGCIGCVVQDAPLAAVTEVTVELPELMVEPHGALLLASHALMGRQQSAPGLTWLRLDMQAI